MITIAMADSADPGHSSIESSLPYRSTPPGLRPNRHDRLWNFAKLCPEICQAYARDPAKASALFRRAKREFLAENWTLNHFQSPESRGLLVLLNSYFQGQGEAPSADLGQMNLYQSPRFFGRRRSRESTPDHLPTAKSARERSWDRDPKVVLIFCILIFLFIFLSLLFFGPASSDKLLESQPMFP